MFYVEECLTTVKFYISLALYVNLVHNGDAETGPCETSNGPVSPVGWDYSGPIIQVSYSNTDYDGQSTITPGPR